MCTTVHSISFTGAFQRPVVSPICFNIHRNNVFNSLLENVSILGYADELVMFNSHLDSDLVS